MPSVVTLKRRFRGNGTQINAEPMMVPMRYLGMGWLIGIAVLTFVVGYAVRERKSRLRSRRYYHDD